MLRNFLYFTRCHCLQRIPVFLNKKFPAFQSTKTSYLKLRLSLVISFVVPLEFHQFDKELYYVVFSTSLWFHGLPMGQLYYTDSLDFMSDFPKILWPSFYPFLAKEPKDLCFRADKNIPQSIQCTAPSDIL